MAKKQKKVDGLTGHAEVGGELRGVAALGAGRRAAPVGLHAAAPHVLVAEARLAAQARVLPQPVARLTCNQPHGPFTAHIYTYASAGTVFIWGSSLTLVVFRLEHLARGLMLELVVLAEESATEAALEHATTVLPHAYIIKFM